MIDTAKDGKNWYLAHSFNRSNYSNKTFIGNTYVLACYIPKKIIEALSPKSEGYYLGSNLAVSDNNYYLNYYTGYYSNSRKQYNIGYRIFELINYTVNYEPFLNSNNYIPLDSLKLENININSLDFYQALKEVNKNWVNLGSLGSEIVDDNSDRNTFPKFISYNGRFIYAIASNFIYNLNDDTNFTNFYVNNPYIKSKYISRTPSTWDFGYSLMNKLELIKDTFNKSKNNSKTHKKNKFEENSDNKSIKIKKLII